MGFDNKKRRGFLGPRRRDIAPTGELAGLPARDSPKPSSYGLVQVRSSRSIVPKNVAEEMYSLSSSMQFFSLVNFIIMRLTF
jgi:hypothetical protein